MIATPRRGLAGQPVWLGALLVLLLAGVARLAWDLGTHWQELRSGGELRFWLLLALRAVGLAGGLWALSLAVLGGPPRGLGRERGVPWGRLLRAAAGILLTAIAVTSLVQVGADLGEDRFAIRSAFRSALLLATSLWLSLPARRPPAGSGAAPRRGGRLAGVLAVNLLLSLLVMEGIALLFARLHPTRLLWDESSARASIAANRLEPGSSYLGFPANSGGFYDEEFHPAGPDDFVVALLADSFGVGIVPYKHNFATVMERRLRRGLPVVGRVAVHNFGVASIGLPEYSWLLENEVPATSPSRIALGLFVGNDISGLESRRRPGYYSVQQLQLFDLGRRLVRLSQASRGRASAGVPVRGRRRRPVSTSGTFDEETFLRIELASFELCNTRNGKMARLYQSAFAWLERLQREAGDRLLVVLIPDEYQVNDALFEDLRRRVADPAAYDRFYPQAQLLRFCRGRGIEVLDLLAVLERANRERPVYRLRDTHWNERGNRIAGEAIADHLLATWSG